MNSSTSLLSCCARGRLRPRRQNGFTLVEVMVAVVMISLLLTTVYGVFTAFGDAQQRLERQETGFHRARIIFDRIGREIRGTYFTSRNPDTLFEGGKTADGESYLTFSTTVGTPEGGRGGGISRVRYELEDDPETDRETRVLMRSETPLFDREGVGEKVYRLAPAIDGLTFRFFKNDAWADSWDAKRDGLPKMIEVALTIRTEGEPLSFLSAFEIPAVTGP